MSKKYVIEIKPEYEDSFKGLMILGAKDSKLFVDTLAVENLEELNSDYINEHYGSLQDEAYHRGLEEGKKATWGLVADASSAEYQRGLDDAWEAARRIIHMPEGDLLNIFTECYSAVCTALQVLLKYDAAEAIEKLKAYEEKQKADDSIIAGDEVKAEDGTAIFFVTWMSDRCICGIDKEGKCYSYEPNEICGKTGRHIDIEKILEEKKE